MLTLRVRAALLTLAVSFALAGCGGGSNGGTLTPAAVVPDQRMTTAATAAQSTADGHIYTYATEAFHPNSLPRIQVFSDEGEWLHVPFATPEWYNWAMMYDPHVRDIYLVDYYGYVTAFDLAGNAVPLNFFFSSGNCCFITAMAYNSRDHLIYILYQYGLQHTLSVGAWTENGAAQTLSGRFPGAGDAYWTSTMFYDEHNGLMYIAAKRDGLITMHAYDSQGFPIHLNGAFAVSADITAGVYDPHSGLIYLATGGGVRAYDEQGNSQALSPGFPVVSGTYRQLAFDSRNNLIYAIVPSQGARGTYPGTMQAFDEQGNLQALPGRFDDPRTSISAFALVP